MVSEMKVAGLMVSLPPHIAKHFSGIHKVSSASIMNLLPILIRSKELSNSTGHAFGKLLAISISTQVHKCISDEEGLSLFCADSSDHRN